jgi:putative DNA primase/helicase
MRNEEKSPSPSSRVKRPKPISDLLLSEKTPMESALEFLARHFQSTSGRRTLHYYRGGFYKWRGRRYRELEIDGVRSQLYKFLRRARVETGSGPAPFNPNQAKVNAVLDALKMEVLISGERDAPFWLGGSAGKPPPRCLIACRNGLLDLRTRTLLKHSSLYFNPNAVPFDYDAKSDEPKAWAKFLRSLWPDDRAARLTLAEVFAYFLARDASQQKIFLLHGPGRSGKGTIARVLTGLVGKSNVTGPTVKSLSERFGLAPLINKQVGIIADARLSHRSDPAAIVERLLTISGGDTLTIDRKKIDAWTGRLGIRFLILTNELPKIADASGALASRFIILTLTKSFYGKEDLRLAKRLLRELPGILNWTLDGLDRLRKRGHFEMPESSREATEQLAELASPIAPFVKDRCRLETGQRVTASKLFEAWCDWCHTQGRDHPGTAQSFGRDLKAAFPQVKIKQGTHGRYYHGISLGGGFGNPTLG